MFVCAGPTCLNGTSHKTLQIVYVLMASLDYQQLAMSQQVNCCFWRPEEKEEEVPEVDNKASNRELAKRRTFKTRSGLERITQV